MKKFFTILIAAGVMVACGTKEQPKMQMVGTIEDATMNVVMVKKLLTDSVYIFLTEDADKTQANGLLIGAPVMVDYTGELLPEGTVATKVATDLTYAKAVGSWTMADPIKAGAAMGVELEVQGDAESINMETLVYKSWELQGEDNKVLLMGQSIGNRETFDFTQTGIISEKDGKLYLAIEGTDVVLEKQDLPM